MGKILYIPGYNESKNTHIELSEILGGDVDFVSLPGHEGPHKDIPFSISSTKELLETILIQRQDVKGLVTTSLSSWPVMESLRGIKSSVEKILLINPAYDPFHAVIRMFHANPLIQRYKVGTKKPSDFLENDRSIFDYFLGNGGIIGDAERFQNDLRRFSNMGFSIENEFSELLEELKQRSIFTKILYNPKDEIIFPQDTILKFRRIHPDQLDDTLQGRVPKNANQSAYSSHIPFFSPETQGHIRKFFGKI